MTDMEKRTDWARLEGPFIRCGLTRDCCDEIGEIVWVQLPEVGTQVAEGDLIVVVESTKAAFDVYSQVTGEVVSVNSDLKKSQALLNNDPEGSGWLYMIKQQDL